MQDLERGRLFRIAPDGSEYHFHELDLSSMEGAVAGLKSPNLSTRYLAWTNLHQAGEKAEASLQQLYEIGTSRERARALWLLAKIKGK